MGAFAELERSLIRVRKAEGIAAAQYRDAYRGRKPALTPEEVLAARGRCMDGVTLASLVRDVGVPISTRSQAPASERR